MKYTLLLLSIFATSGSWAKTSLEFDCGGIEPSFSVKIRSKEVSFASPSVELVKMKIVKTKFEGKTIQITAKAETGLATSDLVITPDLNCVADGVGEVGKNLGIVSFVIY